MGDQCVRIEARIAAHRANEFFSTYLGVRLVPADRAGFRLSREWFEALLYFERLLRLIEPVDGDVVECGVAGGTSLSILASLIEASSRDRHVWGFDSWEGLPEPRSEDLAASRSIAKSGMFAWSSPVRVLGRLRANGFDDAEIERRVTLVKGRFGDTLPGFSGRIALLHIDADLYLSYRDCLENLWPRLEESGIVAFDEYEQPDVWPGARKAADEFLTELGSDAADLRRDETSGKYFAVKRKKAGRSRSARAC